MVESMDYWSHFDSQGASRMVDVGPKTLPSGSPGVAGVRMRPETPARSQVKCKETCWRCPAGRIMAANGRGIDPLCTTWRWIRCR